MNTLADLPLRAAALFDRPALLRRCTAAGFLDWSTQDLLNGVRYLSCGLYERGIRSGDRVALMAESRPEWGVIDLALLSLGAVTVPIYPTLPAVQAGYLLNDSGASLAIVSNLALLTKLREVAASVTSLKEVFVIDPDDETRALGGLPMGDLIQTGQRVPNVVELYRERVAKVRKDDLATLIYTSGTTGEPKGVMLTHGNILSNVIAAGQVLNAIPGDEALSFLPLSHSFERMVFYKYLYDGVPIAFAESLDTVGRDIAQVKPTLMTGVPRFYEKLQSRILEQVEQGSPLKRRVFHWAMRVGAERSRAVLEQRPLGTALALKYSLADRLVFSKIRARTGGRVRYFVSGGAALPASLARFYHAMGLLIVEGYGLTETSPVLTVNPSEAPRFGSVGKAIPGVELRIAADGEILARGPNIMVGYYNKPEATRQVIDADGWFHTGDIGRLDDGYLIITDRKKELLVTSGGKNIAPTAVEGALKEDPLVSEALLVGEGRNFVVALMVPNFSVLAARLARLPAASMPASELVQQREVRELFQAVVDRVNQQLAQFEQIKKFALLSAELSIEYGELTPTMKVKRRVVLEKYGDLIEELYQKGK